MTRPSVDLYLRMGPENDVAECVDAREGGEHSAAYRQERMVGAKGCGVAAS